MSRSVPRPRKIWQARCNGGCSWRRLFGTLGPARCAPARVRWQGRSCSPQAGAGGSARPVLARATTMSWPKIKGARPMANFGVSYLNPAGAPPVQGLYSHVARVAPGELAFIAGQVAIDAQGNVVGAGDVGLQAAQVFANLGILLQELGSDFTAVVQFTTYLTSADHIPAFMAARSKLFANLFADGKYPPNTLLVVDRLVKPEFLLEVEAIARLPG